ncbi:hypothetical protein ILYODFUR_000313 [Ilyodon furcidens]|uniref:Uncharacterized protein n=1 Tax=Ilyodon furcidens TaxID=33524 RepID=A0ABV0T7D1_9TELE
MGSCPGWHWKGVRGAQTPFEKCLSAASLFSNCITHEKSNRSRHTLLAAKKRKIMLCLQSVKYPRRRSFKFTCIFASFSLSTFGQTQLGNLKTQQGLFRPLVRVGDDRRSGWYVTQFPIRATEVCCCKTGVPKSSPREPLTCNLRILRCSSTPESNGLSFSSAEAWQQIIHLNQVCWRREASKRCRIVAFEDNIPVVM